MTSADNASDQHSVFISYTAADLPWAKWVDWQLRKLGYLTVMQHYDHETGGLVDEQIARAIGDSDLVLALLSPGYERSTWCQREWERADQLDKLRQLVVRPYEPSARAAKRSFKDIAELPEQVAESSLLALLDGAPRPTANPGHPGTRAPRYPRQRTRALRWGVAAMLLLAASGIAAAFLVPPRDPQPNPPPTDGGRDRSGNPPQQPMDEDKAAELDRLRVTRQQLGPVPYHPRLRIDVVRSDGVFVPGTSSSEWIEHVLSTALNPIAGCFAASPRALWNVRTTLKLEIADGALVSWEQPICTVQQSESIAPSGGLRFRPGTPCPVEFKPLGACLGAAIRKVAFGPAIEAVSADVAFVYGAPLRP